MLSQRDGQSVRTGDCNRALSHKLQHFIENKLFARLKLRLRSNLETRSPSRERAPPPDLLMKRRKRQQGLQGVTAGRFVGNFIQVVAGCC